MARIGKPLDMLAPFPDMELRLISGERLRLPAAFEGGYGVVLLYRGYW
ncbi:peroxiredoxin [Desulfonema ishimotonii]|uniref:Peroxiredoxin n=1 Tax=Desulfonema ishimotonii TaxID=45657 RepID=A0A401FWE2_9BACT|nr:hypothetical protein [Desulfonema ishimotonii]GBC61286.1 peroxiredoxin [Desulfonema ishimotonii]